MSDDPNSFVIDIHGNIYTCEHQVGRKQCRIGSLEAGLFTDDYRKNGKSLRGKCTSCVFLPKCMGGCESKYLAGEEPCMIEKYIIMAFLEYLLE